MDGRMEMTWRVADRGLLLRRRDWLKWKGDFVNGEDGKEGLEIGDWSEV